MKEEFQGMTNAQEAAMLRAIEIIIAESKDTKEAEAKVKELRQILKADDGKPSEETKKEATDKPNKQQ